MGNGQSSEWEHQCETNNKKSTRTAFGIVKTVKEYYNTITDQEIIDMVLALNNEQLKIFIKEFIKVQHLPIPTRLDNDRTAICRKTAQLLLEYPQEQYESLKNFVSGMFSNTSFVDAMNWISKVAQDPTRGNIFKLVHFLDSHSFTEEEKNEIAEAVDRLSMTIDIDEWKKQIGAILLSP